MTSVSFEALEYHADESFRSVELGLEGSTEGGWLVRRNGRTHLELGPGYRLLRTEACGVCSTDLARHFLPFPLPQVIGHELVASDSEARDSTERFVVEINASHHARGVETDCRFCAHGLSKHCPERIVLGIHDLPGGFGGWVLAPVRAVLAVPTRLPTKTAVLTEPFAAALNAVHSVDPRAGDRILVLGPRRLGLLVVAALAAHRRASGIAFEVVAASRHAELCELARSLGATETIQFEGVGDELADGLADVVIDTTGNPEALGLATRLAARELHLKSTHGREAGGLAHLTELVVDELCIAPLGSARAQDAANSSRIAWLSKQDVPRELAVAASDADPAALFERMLAETPSGDVPRFDAVVVTDRNGVERAIRPLDGRASSLVRPRGEILLAENADFGDAPLLRAIAERGLRVSSSRCGDFAPALELLANDAELTNLGDRLVTHSFESSDMKRAFEVARAPECIKAIVTHSTTR